MGVCFNLYKSFFYLHTWVFSSRVLNPGGCSTYTSSLTTPFKNVVLTSIWCSFHFITATNTRIDMMEALSFYGYKCLFLVYAFFLWEASCYEPCLVFLDVSICIMLDLVDPLWSHDRLLLWPCNSLLDIILHDRLIFLDHCILPLFILCSLFIGGSLFINDVTQQGHIAIVSLLRNPL